MELTNEQLVEMYRRMVRIGEKLVRVPRGAEWRRVMMLSLTFDHRAVDGAPAAAFLQSIGKHLEHPKEMPM